MTRNASATDPRTLRLTLLIAFLTGVTFLVYEMTWIRQATLSFGVSVYAYGMVLAAYMGGVALGSLVIAARLHSRHDPWRALTFSQFGLALTGILAYVGLSMSGPAISTLAGWLNAGPTELTFLRLMFSWTFLILPTMCIGAVLPLLIWLASRMPNSSASFAGRIYAANAAGSVLGCVLTPFLLIPEIGTFNAIILAASVNLAVALMAFRRSRRPAASILRSASLDQPTAPALRFVTPLNSRQQWFVVAAYSLSGFVALGFEIAWGRMIGVSGLGAVYSFALIVAVFLTGLSLGGWISSRWVALNSVSLNHFGALLLIAALTTLVSLRCIHLLPDLAALAPTDTLTWKIITEAGFSILTILPFSLIVGMLFPIAQRLATGSVVNGSGRRTALLLGFNTLGCVAGALFTTFLFVPHLGLHGSALLLASTSLLLGILALGAGRIRRTRLSAVAIASLLLLIGVHATYPKRYLGIYRHYALDCMFYAEGVEATVAVFAGSPQRKKFSTVNGALEVPTDAMSMNAFHLLGYLPGLLHEQPNSALMLSFGNGIATGALSEHRIPVIDAVDLAAEQFEAARQCYTRENRNVMDYTGLTTHVEDARNFLLRASRRYDIITADATHPANSSSWALYTSEFYSLVQQRLSEHGVFAQWLPLHGVTRVQYRSILRTILNVFPDATLWYPGATHSIVVAGSQPTLAKVRKQLMTRMQYNEEAVEQLLQYWVMGSDELQHFAGAGPIVRDDDACFLPHNESQLLLAELLEATATIRSTASTE